MMTWRKAALGVAAAAAVTACAALAAAQVQTYADDEVTVSGVHDQLVFAAGDEVTLNLSSTDDVLAAGGDVSARGASFAHVFLAGGEISFTESTASDLIAAGGEIDIIGGEVTDDFIAAGGRITLGREARVGGDVVISGGELEADAPIGGGLRAAGGRIRLGGQITGDVYLDGGRIIIGPDTHIMGSLTHRGRSVEIAPGAQIDGQVTALRPRPEPDLRPLAAFATWVAASILFGLFLTAVLIAVALPRLMNDTANAVRERPLSSLGLGLLLAIFTPMVVVFLAVTLLGLPLAFVLGAAFALLWPLAIVGAVYGLGMLARSRMRNGAPEPSPGGRALWAGLSMIVFIVLGLIPVLGFLLWLVAYILGLGAVTTQMFRALSRPAAAAA